MNIIVCVKLVADIEGIIKLNSKTNSVDESGLNYVTNPRDLVAVEMAVRYKGEPS